jgi:protease IV
MDKKGIKENIVALLVLVFCLVSLFIGMDLEQKKIADNDSDGSSSVTASWGKDRVSVIGLEGVIYDEFYTNSPFSQGLSAASVKHLLKKSLKDSSVKAVLLRLNSPGGTVAASQEIYELVKELKENEKPVVVSMGDVCASGCYYIASAADKIIANPGTLTGSIGVISQGFNITGLLEKLGIQDQTFKAGKYKDLGSSQRPMSEREKEILQAILDDSYAQFLDDIYQARGIEKSELEKIAEGLIYTGQQAKKVKLVDELGTYEYAIQATRDLLEERKYSKSDSIFFDETWRNRNFSGLNEVLGFDFYESFSKFQPLWLMP